MTAKKKSESRVRKGYVQSKQAAKLENTAKIQVYLSDEHRKLIEEAIDIQQHGTLSGFCALAAVKEARRIISERARTSATS